MLVEPEIEAAWRRFQDSARRYCDVIDAVSALNDSEAFYAGIAVPLADLYAAGRALPMVAVSADDSEIEKLTSEEWWALFNAIDELTGSEDPYRTIVHPQEDAEPVQAALADDLADIYRDVAPAVNWDDPERLNDLLFELRVSFQGHWARHALEAMRVIHWRYPYR